MRGEAPSPLPNRSVPRARATLQINRAWFVPSGSLVLEDATGELWQPSEAGLGWYTGEIDPAWKPARFSHLLPASVVARPKSAKCWNYTLEFSSGFALRASFDRQAQRPIVRITRSTRTTRSGPKRGAPRSSRMASSTHRQSWEVWSAFRPSSRATLAFLKPFVILSQPRVLVERLRHGHSSEDKVGLHESGKGAVIFSAPLTALISVEWRRP